MKKSLLAILALTAAAAMLSACGKGTADAEPSMSPSPTIEAAEQNTSGTEKEDGTRVKGTIDKADDAFQQESGTPVPTLSPEESDFRSLKWGMTRDEVIAVEGTGYSLNTEDNMLVYSRVREEGFPADAQFEFDSDGGLSMATFFIEPTEAYKDLSQYISDYDALVAKLTARYGTPDLSQEYYQDGVPEEADRAKHPELILENKLNYRTAWKTEKTELRVVLIPRNKVLSIGLQYKPASE